MLLKDRVLSGCGREVKAHKLLASFDTELSYTDPTAVEQPLLKLPSVFCQVVLGESSYQGLKQLHYIRAPSNVSTFASA